MKAGDYHEKKIYHTHSYNFIIYKHICHWMYPKADFPKACALLGVQADDLNVSCEVLEMPQKTGFLGLKLTPAKAVSYTHLTTPLWMVVLPFSAERMLT